jgi:short-subunit dehydrogenase
MQRETVLITGASRGIGAAAAARYAAPHRHLILASRSREHLTAICGRVRALGGAADYITVDLSSADDVDAFLDELQERFGVPQGVVLNAGTSNNERLRDSNRSSVEYELAVNYVAPAEILMRLCPRMASQGGGRVVVVGSLASLVPFPGNATYAASKAALITLIRSLRLEHDQDGIQFGIVLPGLTDTDMTSHTRSLLPRMSPDAVATAILRCYEEGTTLEVPGVLNGLAARVFGAFPDAAGGLLARVSDLLIPKHTAS